MIKGVNKKIIEINNPDSSYFDKVILYIKPNNEIHTTNELSFEVDRYLKSLIKDNKKKNIKRNQNLSIGFIVGMAVVLTLIVALILL